MTLFIVKIRTDYNYYFTITVGAKDNFSARRIARRWFKYNFFSDCVTDITVNNI